MRTGHVSKEDPAVLKRMLETARARNTYLRAAREKANDPQASPHAEQALDSTTDELVRLQGEHIKQALELRQLVRRLGTMARDDLDAEHLHRQQTGRDAATQEMYLKSMSDMQKKQREKCAGRVALATSLKEDWGRWMKMLDAAASQLQRQPAIAAKLEGAQSPAEALLEMIRRKEARRTQLKAKEKEFKEKEAAINKQLHTMRSKASTQQELLDAANKALGVDKDAGFFDGGGGGGGGGGGNTFMTDTSPPAGW
jgi:hypothetical protein